MTPRQAQSEVAHVCFIFIGGFAIAAALCAIF